MTRLRFLGAARQVTGSRYCLQTGEATILVDCGMFQERAYLGRNWEESPVPPEAIDALILTHAHIDHCGLIPRLVQQGFRGPIYATRPTVPLAGILLRDAAHIQVEDAQYKKKRHEKEGRRGKYPEIPLFTEADVVAALPLLQAVPYETEVEVARGMTATFYNAGHILGSATVEVKVNHGGPPSRWVFSGDIGQWDKPLIRDPVLPQVADYVVMESTYGNRNHEPVGEIEGKLERIARETLEKGGNLVIPTFALERAQELIYYFSRLVYDNRIPKVTVFVDSPMATDITQVFRSHREFFDDETLELIRKNEPPLQFQGLRYVRSVEDSKAINAWPEPCIILSTSGMCTAGRIKHHLKHNITRPECTILFVGYQAEGTLGRQILERPEKVRIHGQLHPVRARIEQLDGLSAHADQSGLLRWIGHLNQPPRQVFLTHGEPEAAGTLAQLIAERTGFPVTIPSYGQQFTA